MKINEIITEMATDILYHYRSISAARKILVDGKFTLSTSMGVDSEEWMAPEGYPYFLSATRSKLGAFHSDTNVGTSYASGCMFVLDGRKLNQKYKTKPVSWDSRYHQNKSSNRGYGASEAEDRVFSKTNSIDLACVRTLHLLIGSRRAESDVSTIVQITKLAEAKGIACFVYDDWKNWLHQNTKKAINLSDTIGSPPVATPQPQNVYYGRLGAYVDLAYTMPDEELSQPAQNLIPDIKDMGNSDVILRRYAQYLKSVFNNEYTPRGEEYHNIVKLLSFMKKNKIKSFADFLILLCMKWDNYTVTPQIPVE